MDEPPLQPSDGTNDPEATFRSAREILANPASVDELQRGIALLEKARELGSVSAIELGALFEAMGIARPQSWERAFDLLELAAGKGSSSARRQLLLLSDPEAPWETVHSAEDADWKRVRSAISLERLLAHGDRVHLSEAPRIRSIERFATPSESRWLMERARPSLSRATVLKKGGDHGVAEGRSNSAKIFRVIELDVVMELIRARISAATRVPLPLFEPTQVFQYSVGQEFRPHHDFLDPGNEAYRDQLVAGQRIATFLIYLNDDFEGGETDFPAVGIRYRGSTGDALFWANLDTQNRPDPLTMHAGLPPTSGEKWILSQWIRDRPGSPSAAP